MTEPPQKTCASCQAALIAISVFSRSKEHRPLEYVEGIRQPGFWGSVDTEGVLSARMCPSCRRVELFATPFPKA